MQALWYALNEVLVACAANFLTEGTIMMYNGNNDGGEKTQACRRDYEAEAKRMKERIDNNKAFTAAIKNFVDCDEFHQIEDYGDRKTLFAMYGALSMKTPSMERKYEWMLDELEKEA